MSDPQADPQPVVRPEAILEAVENGLNCETAQAYRRQLAEERDRLRLLLEINNAVVSHLDFRSLFQQIASALRRVLQQDYLSVALCDAERRSLRVHALDFPAGKGLLQEEIVVPWKEAPAALVTRPFGGKQP
jgi:formate hydrogenlyase transcriptional activator